jgi:hypothetical protein
MMRRTVNRLMVTPHPVIPGRPSVRGLLYRPSHMNMYSRLAMISREQRTEEEGRLFSYIVHPEIYALTWLCSMIIMYCAYATYFDATLGVRFDSKRRFAFEGMDENEVFQRNWEMNYIMQQHRELIAETRKKYVPVRPAVYDPPEVSVNWYDPRKTDPMTNFGQNVKPSA